MSAEYSPTNGMCNRGRRWQHVITKFVDSEGESMDPEIKMLNGVAFGRVEMIREAHAEGVDLDSQFRNSDGRTPLTEAILGGMGEPEAVRTLIELGADPSRRDANGWTPWLGCIARADDRVVAEEMAEIREILEEAGASREDDALFELYDRACEGDVEGVRQLLDKGLNPHCQQLCPLGAAVGTGNLEVAELLLQRGAPPDGADVDSHGETCLMHAARKGDLDMVQLLVEHGADVSRSLPEDSDWTAASFARDAGHDKIADWLARHGDTSTSGGIPAQAREGGPKARYEALYRFGINGINYELDTDAIVDRLMEWDRRYGIHLVDVRPEGPFTVQFERLDDDVDAMSREIYDFCPDIVDQGFGAMAEESGHALPDDMQQLVDGLDSEDEDFGLKVLARWLRQHSAVGLWWD